MNDRIQKLAASYFPRDGEGNICATPEIITEFAELIVRECIGKIESKRSSGENNDQWTFTRDLCYHNMILDLKEHFGVEQ